MNVQVDLNWGMMEQRGSIASMEKTHAKLFRAAEKKEPTKPSRSEGDAVESEELDRVVARSMN